MLRDFAKLHREADAPLQQWRYLIEHGRYTSYADLKVVFNAVDRVDDHYVFDIGGNKYRVITYIHFQTQHCYVKHVLTHKEYDKGRWRRRQ